MELPDAVIDILTSLRKYLQDKCEPPVYVSDRRFMKSVNLLQVAAYADGRDQVHILSKLMPMPLWQNRFSPKAHAGTVSLFRLFQPMRGDNMRGLLASPLV